jgi:hypothetical protein
MVVKRELLYPFLLECIQYCPDSFWESLFEDLAYGSPPMGAYISKNFLCCSYKNREFVYKLERKNELVVKDENDGSSCVISTNEPRTGKVASQSETLYNDIYTLLTEKLGVFSQKEKLKKKLAFKDFENSVRNSKHDWSSIKKKTVKNSLYEQYVIDMKNKHKLSIKSARYLLALIMTCLLFKTITSKDVEFEDNKIQAISGIEIKDGEIKLLRPLISSIDTAKLKEDEGNSLSKNWESYIKLVRTKVKIVEG